MKVFQYVAPDKSLELIWQVETGKLTLNVQHGGVSIVLPDDARIGLSKALWLLRPNRGPQMWGWLMNFWRSLFDRQIRPFKPTYPVTGVEQPTATTTTVSQTPIGFQTLALSSTNFATGTPSSGAILNASGGASIIVAVGLPAGLTINSALRTWAWSGSGATTSGSFTLYENFPGGSGNPFASVISYTIGSTSSGHPLGLLLTLTKAA